MKEVVSAAAAEKETNEIIVELCDKFFLLEMFLLDRCFNLPVHELCGRDQLLL